MRRFFYVTVICAFTLIAPMSATAGVDVHIGIPFPPAIVFSAPPVAVVIPGTYVYGFPDVEEDIYFHNGWWWRPWGGRWYRSRDYGSGWEHYRQVPPFYSRIPSGWRNDYRDRHWQGHQWSYQRIPHDRLQHNWKNWEKNRHWERQNTWGVRGWRSEPQGRRLAQHFQPQPSPKAQNYQEHRRPESMPHARVAGQPHVIQPHMAPQPRQHQPNREMMHSSQHSQGFHTQGGNGGGHGRQNR